jgi:hypothetical protein
MSKLFLPDDVIGIIRQFAKPIGLRLDWRKCKRNESRRIKGSNKALYLWYKWILGDVPMIEEIKEWTFYGRRHLIWESKRGFWSPGLDLETQEDDPEWYEKRFMLGTQQGWPKLMHSTFPEVHMYDISLVV